MVDIWKSVLLALRLELMCYCVTVTKSWGWVKRKLIKENMHMKVKIWFENINQTKSLTLSWQRSLSYRNQSIKLLCKSMDRFLYDRDLRHKRVNIFMVRLGDGVGECLLMTQLGHLRTLKLKWNANWNYMKATWKSRPYENQNIIWKHLPD